MRIRPQLTIEDVLRLHEGIEWTCPPGSEGRGVALEEVHQLYLNQAALLRRHRQLPNDRPPH